MRAEPDHAETATPPVPPARVVARAPARTDAATLLALQRSAGNRVVTRLILQRDYEDERSDSALPDAPVELSFDGNTLRMHGAGVDTSWPAVSGRPDGSGGLDYSLDRQRQKGVGPIPEGKYWLDPRQLVNLEERLLYGLRYETAWGTHRITIHPFTTTETHGRGGFFIHGGTVRGSAGCIDLTTNMASFARRLAAYAPVNEGRVCGPSAEPHKVNLRVRYSPMGDFERAPSGAGVAV